MLRFEVVVQTISYVFVMPMNISMNYNIDGCLFRLYNSVINK
jgi:hypothetical protein